MVAGRHNSMKDPNLYEPDKDELEVAFKSWFQHNFGMPPSPPSVRTHVEFGAFLLSRPVNE